MPQDYDVPSDERTWIARIRASDAHAFDALVLTYFQLLAHVAYGVVGTVDNAEDIVQDVLFRVWERRASWDPQGPIRAYLVRAVRNQALNVIKHATVESRYQNDDAVVAAALRSPQSPDAALIAAADTAALAKAILALPERRRLALRLRYHERLTHAEIGDILGVSAKAAKELLLRTVDALRQRLDARA